MFFPTGIWVNCDSVESWIRGLILLQTTVCLQQKNLFYWVNFQPGQFPEAIILYDTAVGAFTDKYVP